jgi:hypothetical protein
MDDLVTRLRATYCQQIDPERQAIRHANPDGPEAADRIEALEKALEPFVRTLRRGSGIILHGFELHVTREDIERARTLLNKDTPNNVG